MSTTRQVPTPQGDARLVTYRAREPRLTLLLTHGAGGGIEAPDLLRIATSLPRLGITVVLVEMPWRVQGKRIAPRPALIDEAYRAVVTALRSRTPLVLGGRSAGARSACRIAASAGATGVVALAFPLHPPGKPENTRVDELLGAGVPALVVQGERDPFGAPSEFPDGCDLAVVPSGDHSLRVPKSAPLSQDDALAIVVEAILEWSVREIVGD